jgi:hypothetical protein
VKVDAKSMNPVTDEEFTKPVMDVFWETREKLDMYLIGVAFTVLGAAVQTAKFADAVSRTAQWLELIAWAALLLSGVSGLAKLWVLSWLRLHDPFSRRVIFYRNRLHELVKELTELRDRINKHPDEREAAVMREQVEETAATQASALADADKIDTELEGQKKAFLPAFAATEGAHYPAFFIGACLLVAARAHDPLWRLLGWL